MALAAYDGYGRGYVRFAHFLLYFINVLTCCLNIHLEVVSMCCFRTRKRVISHNAKLKDNTEPDTGE